MHPTHTPPKTRGSAGKSSVSSAIQAWKMPSRSCLILPPETPFSGWKPSVSSATQIWKVLSGLNSSFCFSPQTETRFSFLCIPGCRVCSAHQANLALKRFLCLYLPSAEVEGVCCQHLTRSSNSRIFIQLSNEKEPMSLYHFVLLKFYFGGKKKLPATEES